MGSLGLVLLLVAYFILAAILCRLQDPEKWFRVTNLGMMLLNWNAIWKFLFFLHASFALTGGAILVSLPASPTPRPQDPLWRHVQIFGRQPPGQRPLDGVQAVRLFRQQFRLPFIAACLLDTGQLAQGTCPPCHRGRWRRF